MNKYLKKVFIISASALLFLSVVAGVNNVQARRYHYRYHRRVNRNKYGYWKHYRKHGRTRSYFVRYKTGYFHNGRWVRYHRHSHFVVRFRRITPKRRHRAHRVHHYHIDVEGVDDGWTTNYHYYKSESAKIQHAINVQTAKDEEAEGINPNQNDNDQDQSDSSTASTNNSQNNQQTTQPRTNNDDSSENTNANTDESSNNSVQNNINEMNSETLANINQDREENGEQPYQESQALDQLANMRSQQYAEDPNISNPHVDPNTGNRYVDEDARSMGLNGLYLSENVDVQSIGAEQEEDGDPTTYNPQNGSQMADVSNNEFMNHDQFSGNSHRRNILLGAHYIGVGTTYNPNDQNYYIAEDIAY